MHRIWIGLFLLLCHLNQSFGIGWVSYREENDLNWLVKEWILFNLVNVMLTENLNLVSLVIFQLNKLIEQGFKDLNKLANVDFLVILVWKGLRNKPVHEKLQLLPMLFIGWKNQEWLLEWVVRWNNILKVIELILPENVNFRPWGSLPIVNPTGNVLDMLDNKVHWNSVVSESRNNDIRVNHCRQDKIPEWVLHEFVILQQNTFNASASLLCVPLQSSTQADVI